MKIEEFEKLMMEIAIAFGAQLKPEAVPIYFKHLQDYTVEQLQESVDKMVKEEPSYNHIPSIATILKYAPKIQETPCLDYPKFDHLAVEDLSELLVYLKRHRTKEGYDPEIGTLYYPPQPDMSNALLQKAIAQTFGTWQVFCANHPTEWDMKRLREVLLTCLKDPFYRAEADKILGGKGRWLPSKVARAALSNTPKPELTK